MILVVDDKQTNLDFMADYLTRQGHTPVLARSGGQALALVADQPPDLILLDYMMPGMTGFEVLQILKANARWRHIPVIVFSSLEDIDSIARCIELGAEDYLPKIFNPTLLQARIDASLEKKRLREREQAQLVHLETAKQRADKLLNIVIPIGIALSVEQMVEALSTLAVVALEAYLREQGLRQQVRQLTIEIDEARQAKQVAEITETDYFQQLQAKARRLRDRR